MACCCSCSLRAAPRLTPAVSTRTGTGLGRLSIPAVPGQLPGSLQTCSAPKRDSHVVALFGGGKAKEGKPAASRGCKTCNGKGGIDCVSCKGTGKSKTNGNMFERWKCYKCQGFGLVGCPTCGKGGLTPEQRGER